jgi:predicted ATPase/DNA-binding response OmpR family regulator/Tfp pilus assembly protein PilF
VDLERRTVEAVDGGIERLTSLEANLLGFLAAHTDRVVGRDELLSEVWGCAPNTLTRTCDRAIRRLRTKLEADPSQPECLLTVHGSGYRLVLGGASVPVSPPAPLAPRRILRLEDRVVDLDLARVDTESGPVPLTANELAMLELLWAASGRSVDRETLLRRIWGSTVGRPLDNAVVRLRKKLERDPSRPRVLVTTTSGYRLELEVLPRPHAGGSRPGGTLPANVDRWVGREDELAAIFARIEAGDRLVVLVGPGGMGKTRLAATAAGLLAQRRGCEAWWFDLTGVDRAEQLWAVLARGLQVPTVGVDPAVQIVRALGALGPAVVVLDNLDELAGPEVAPIAGLYEAAPDVTFLATSRILLRLRGERRLEVGPLAPADAEALFVDRATRPPDPSEQPDVVALVAELEGMPLAIELAAAATRFLSVAEIQRRSREGRLGPGHRDRPERYRSLAASLDGSWELLSPWARSALAQLSVFRGGFTTDAAERVLELPERPESAWTVDVLEELVDASLIRLAPDGSRFTLLQVVARYAGERLADEERVGAESRHGAWAATLGSPSTLAASHGPAEVELRRGLRSELDNLTIACERAIARGDAAVASASACAVWTVLELTGPVKAGADLLARVAATAGAEPRVSTAAGRALQLMGELHLAERYYERATKADPYAALGRVQLMALRDDGATRPLLEPLLARAVESGDRVLECFVRLARAWEHRRRLDNEAVARELEHAHRVAVWLGARRLGAQVEIQLAVLQKGTGTMDRARAWLTRALATARDVGARALEARVMAELGALAESTGGLEEGLAWMRTALELQRDIGDRLAEVKTLGELARGCSVARLDDEAEQRFYEASELAREIGLFEDQFAVLGNWANLALRRGRAADAERRLEEALALAREHGFVRGEALASSSLGNLYTSTGRPLEALATFERALELHRQVGRPAPLGATLGNMGVALAELGEWERARELLTEALRIHRETGNLRLQGGWHQMLAWVAVRQGDRTAAVDDVEQALRIHRQFDDRTNLGRTLLVRAEIEHAAGETERARATWAEAEALLGSAHAEVTAVRRLLG